MVDGLHHLPHFDLIGQVIAVDGRDQLLHQDIVDFIVTHVLEGHFGNDAPP